MGYQHVILLGRGPDGKPKPVSVDADGKLMVSGGGGGGGDATAANQSTQIDQLANILTEITGVATDAAVLQVKEAIDLLGDGSTITQVVNLLATDTGVQNSILGKLTAIDIDTDASATALLAIQSKTNEIDDNTDQIESILSQIRDNTATPSKDNNLGIAVSKTVKSAAGVLIGLTARHTDGSSLYLWIFDNTAASGTSLIIPVLVPASGQIIIGTDLFTTKGLAFSTGLTYGFSTSGSTYSAYGTAANCFATVIYS